MKKQVKSKTCLTKLNYFLKTVNTAFLPEISSRYPEIFHHTPHKLRLQTDKSFNNFGAIFYYYIDMLFLWLRL